jgi:hypothetical protein
VTLEADDPTKPVRGQATFVDESIERARTDAQQLGGIAAAQPFRYLSLRHGRQCTETDQLT